MFDLANKRIFVAGASGMLGASLVRRLAREDCEILVADRASLDLTDQFSVRRWIGRERPDAIVLAAAKVGGIIANSMAPADFIYENLAIETNVIEAAHRNDVDRLLFLGSSCVYPKLASQPIAEEALLSSSLEPTNQWYAVAKIAGIKLCEAYRRQHGRDYICVMPTNLYGPGDNFGLTTSHVLAALIQKTHSAKVARADTLTLWGTGTPLREFLHVEDCADACVHLLKRYSDEVPINIGYGEDISICDLAAIVSHVVGYTGKITWDTTKPDGTPRKLLDCARLHRSGWMPSINLQDGIRTTYEWFLRHRAQSLQ